MQINDVLVAVVVVHAVCSSSLSCFSFCASQPKKMRFIAGEHLFVYLFVCFFFHLILFYKREKKKGVWRCYFLPIDCDPLRQLSYPVARQENPCFPVILQNGQ